MKQNRISYFVNVFPVVFLRVLWEEPELQQEEYSGYKSLHLELKE